METDFTVFSEGGIYLLKPNSDAGRDWCEENLPSDVQSRGCGSQRRYAIEHRYMSDIVHGIIEESLSICDIDDQDLDQERH